MISKESPSVLTVLHILVVLSQVARVSGSISDLSDEVRVKTPPLLPLFDLRPLSSSHPRAHGSQLFNYLRDSLSGIRATLYLHIAEKSARHFLSRRVQSVSS